MRSLLVLYPDQNQNLFSFFFLGGGGFSNFPFNYSLANSMQGLASEINEEEQTILLEEIDALSRANADELFFFFIFVFPYGVQGRPKKTTNPHKKYRES